MRRRFPFFCPIFGKQKYRTLPSFLYASATEKPDTRAARYGRLAAIYDVLGELWTAGNIRRSKLWQLRWLQPGERVLFAGAGTAEEAVLAARAGVQVSIIDLSAEMIGRARARIRQHGLDDRIEVIQGDLFEHRPAAPYDAVVGNYFLDVFGRSVMLTMLAHIDTLVGSGGRLHLAGFAPVTAPRWQRWFVGLWHGIPVLVFYLLLGNGLHGVYNYAGPLHRLGWRIAALQYFYFGKNRIPVTHSLVAVRSAFTPETA